MRDYPELEQNFIRWKNIVNESNRFYDKTPLLNILYTRRKMITYTVYREESFFRGRIFNLDDKVSNGVEYYDWVNSKDKVFQGYGAEESGAPLAKNVKEGRLNCNGISFLYTCSDVNTVIYELRPTREEIVSIAEFITKKNLCFADLTQSKSRQLVDKELADLLWLIAKEFATPHYAGHNYAFTQYLAGHFMNMGFEGVIFKSSLNPNGENFVFFYPKDCKAINSRLYKVNDISISSIPITRREV